MRKLVLAAAAALLPFAAQADETASLSVTVTNVSDAGGELKIGVYDEAGFKSIGALPLAHKTVHARPGRMSVTIDGIAPGTYGVKMYQDINRNGYFDYGRKLTEPVGFSNDARASSGVPDFADAKITLVPGANAIAMSLH
ncbi:MAG TPA: DUF2141 domain-containing protein [Rhizomicrobium sp.]|nr:DUF2141 domain-containing protein [Rhizomicrobium sp.]